MTSVTQAGNAPRTTSTGNTKVGLSETELTKNLGLIENTVERALSEIESAVKQLKQLDENSFAAGAPRPGDTASTAGTGGAFPTEKPVLTEDTFRPPDKLKVDDKGTITTPGGYKIEQLGQFEWKISGPDGKNTRIWGDPHVDESDGGKFDFKRNTTFKLPDGTEINCSTVPWGNAGMTVTGKLDITNGADHIAVTDIDKGKGKVGELTKDGYETTVAFQWDDAFKNNSRDLLVMGKDSDDWANVGKEVIGDEGGGATFKHGKDLEFQYKETPSLLTMLPEPAKEKKDAKTADVSKQRDALMQQISDHVSRAISELGKSKESEKDQPIEDRFKSVTKMFKALDEINSLNDMIKPRNVFF
ncbi:DUF1521 domain-containing protein [Myxococcus sp. CA051A]|uniref:DUF1521 domain-containing protein n=1 Tax=unclassified Myxococcus TaxID=2648731 RepID=UPI00157AD0C2|nr:MULTISPECIES: DUF1521 domain-containing protein [unclassified Myxococcus]NTX04274.1 DUF1521 domain-containing protein [Myxococcus sp. CA040A]NTX13106.1 DUF1521 domain-containing protein [Myxococcus sp. CA056]NTX36442.1 DUF1521 domain-containing protein [Myxococcus sp. CA033]NTX57807.1 DUF1521 domain-containing protein [Myxococcus sp. CA039A]NTX64750.1 DUF1521 domain-containing protein [Myxococcus sp. CA051A]